MGTRFASGRCDTRESGEAGMDVVNEGKEAPHWRVVMLLLGVAWLVGLASCSYWALAG
jgi:hypothetical protein